VIIPVLLAALASGGVLVTLVSKCSPAPASPPSPTQLERISIQDDYYHIGDIEYTAIIQGDKVVGVVYFSHPAPQNNPFTKEFELLKVPRSAVLHLIARSIDPDEKKSPTKIFLNGTFLDFLNRYSKVETMEEKPISIPVNTSLLREGKNTIQIFVETTLLEPWNVDDIEFRDVYLEIVP